jgi:hypothetical protein
MNQTKTKSHTFQQNHDLSTDYNLFIDSLDIYYLNQLKNLRMTIPWVKIISINLFDSNSI